jgi:hypothetical protein
MTRRPLAFAFRPAREAAFSLSVALGLGAAVPAAAAPPEDIRAFASDVPRVFSELENLVARERMTQLVFDTASDRIVRRRVLVSDYQIAPLEEDPTVSWEFRFVREVDGKPVPGAARQLDDFLRLRHRDSREERMRITNLGLSSSLPDCYWHNLTLVLRAFTGDNVDNFDWRPLRSGWAFEQVRGPGIPQNHFDPRSPRHYPKGTLSFEEGSLSHLQLEWSSDGIVTSAQLDFSRPVDPTGSRGLSSTSRRSAGRARRERSSRRPSSTRTTGASASPLNRPRDPDASEIPWPA